MGMTILFYLVASAENFAVEGGAKKIDGDERILAPDERKLVGPPLPPPGIR